ncbi:helix-turn-helix transcriptional regulator [Rahnella victoriana]
MSNMTLQSVETFLAQLSESERKMFIDRLDTFRRFPFDLSELKPLIMREMKQQNITYEEMALQIGTSLSTLKRMIADPAGSKTNNLHTLLNELGINVWLDK